MSNVPDDWGMYYERCNRCGTRYHASEGGCGCLDDIEPCQCGHCRWNGADDIRCARCGTGPHVDGPVRTTIHTARIHHVSTTRAGLIKPGDRYKRTVAMGHYPDGAFTMTVTKVRVDA